MIPPSTPVVAILPTGGTITSTGGDRLDLADYASHRTWVGADELLAAVPEVHRVAPVRLVDHERLVSHAMSDGDWLRLRRTVAGLLGQHEVGGVVITHGTNTLEETAYFLSLTLENDKPVVLVGAMRPFSALSGDGGLNLLNAVRVAAATESRGRGVLVVMNDTIHAAREVTKTSTYRVDAFASPRAGPLGFADADGRVVYHRRPERVPVGGPALVVDPLEQLPRVDIATAHVGADSAAVDGFLRAGARGIVSAGTGAGYPTPSQEQALRSAAAAGVVVCLAARSGGGRVVRRASMAESGFVAADDLDPPKARILLALGLSAGDAAPDTIQKLFDRW